MAKRSQHWHSWFKRYDDAVHEAHWRAAITRRRYRVWHDAPNRWWNIAETVTRVIPPAHADINALAAERLRRHHAVVEQACEAALAGGLYGVSFEWDAEVTRAWVDPDVPYGSIHERVTPPGEGTPDE